MALFSRYNLGLLKASIVSQRISPSRTQPSHYHTMRHQKLEYAPHSLQLVYHNYTQCAVISNSGNCFHSLQAPWRGVKRSRHAAQMPKQWMVLHSQPRLSGCISTASPTVGHGCLEAKKGHFNNVARPALVESLVWSLDRQPSSPMAHTMDLVYTNESSSMDLKRSAQQPLINILSLMIIMPVRLTMSTLTVGHCPSTLPDWL